MIRKTLDLLAAAAVVAVIVCTALKWGGYRSMCFGVAPLSEKAGTVGEAAPVPVPGGDAADATTVVTADSTAVGVPEM